MINHFLLSCIYDGKIYISYFLVEFLIQVGSVDVLKEILKFENSRLLLKNTVKNVDRADGLAGMVRRLLQSRKFLPLHLEEKIKKDNSFVASLPLLSGPPSCI